MCLFFMGLVSSSPRNAMNLKYNNRSMNNNNVTNTWIGVRPALVSIRNGCASSQNKTICRKDQSINNIKDPTSCVIDANQSCTDFEQTTATLDHVHDFLVLKWSE